MLNYLKIDKIDDIILRGIIDELYRVTIIIVKTIKPLIL